MYTGSMDAVSNRQDWDCIIQVLDQDTDEALDLSAATVVFEVRDRASGLTRLSATTGNGKISIVDVGVFQISFPDSDMNQLRSDTWEVGCTITINGTTRQAIAGLLPVIDGVVSQ